MKLSRLISLFTLLLILSTPAFAQLSNQGMLDTVVSEFAVRASAWQTVIMSAASYLFWTLGTISLTFTFGFMALRNADIGEFFAEFIRFILFFGFFLWLLRNGPVFANSIIQSLLMIGQKASGSATLTPSGIVDIGFMIWEQAINNLSIWSPVDTFVGIVLSIAILVLLATVAVNMLLLYVCSWLLAYGGMIFLGFGGSRWTSEMSINYFRTVFSVGVQLMTMVLLVGVGNDLLNSFYTQMAKGSLNFREMGVMLVLCLTLHLLVSRLPSIVAGIATGSAINSSAGVGSFGSGAVFGAAMGASSMAAASANMAAALAMHGASSAAGGASALAAAVAKGSENVDNNRDLISGVFGNEDTAKMVQEFYKNNPAGKSPSSTSHSSGGQSISGGSAGSGFMSAASRAGRIAADAGANLAKGAMDVGAGKVSSLKQSAADRIADTTGGRIASAINSSGADRPTTPSATTGQAFSGNGLSGGDGSAAPPTRDPSRYIHGVDFSKMKFPGPGLPEGWGED